MVSTEGGHPTADDGGDEGVAQRAAERALIGRERDLAGLASLALPGTLTTIAGVGGVGKSAVARALLARPMDRFVDGWMCDLAPIFDADAVAATVEDAIGAVPADDVGSLDSVVATLRGRTGLLILDNVEQVVDGATPLIERLRAECPALAVLATSREILRIPGEQIWSLDPLDAEREAPVLFVRRALEVDPAFDPDACADVVAEICRALDGLPLAIELAAAQLATMSIHDLAQRLDQRFRVLRDDARDDRQSTLAATVRWSHDLLDPSERRLFDRLSIFQGGFDVVGARNVIAVGDRDVDVARILENLADRSMLVRSREHPGRYHMLETLRHLGDRHLADRGERSSTRNAHLDHVIDLSSDISSRCFGPDWEPGLARLEVEWDNVRAALNWAIDTQRHADVDRLLRELFFICRWSVEIEPATWARRLVEAAAALGIDGVPIGAPVHLHLAHAHFVAGEAEESLAANLAAAAPAAGLSDRNWGRHFAAIDLERLGRLDDAVATSSRLALDAAPRQVEQAIQTAAAAVIALGAGASTLAEVQVTLASSAAMAADVASPVAIGQVAFRRGIVAVSSGDHTTAAEHFDHALRVARMHRIRALSGDVLAAQTATPGFAGLAAAKRALDEWERHRDVGNEYVVLEAAGINLAEIGRIEPAAVILASLERDGRRGSDVAPRRAAAARVIEAHHGSAAWSQRGQGLTRLEVLEYAQEAIDDALRR